MTSIHTVTAGFMPKDMSIESIPKFTDPAAKLWAKVPVHAKKLLLSNV
jgi:hypothetical protein